MPPSTDIPQAFASLSPELARALHARGFSELTAVQQAVVEHDVSGADLRICSQTGSGKTLAIGLVLAPSLQVVPPPSEGGARGPLALVIVPTRELAAQVGQELSWLYAGLRGARVGVVTGGTPLDPECRMLARGITVLVGTPGRLLDHLERGVLSLATLENVVLDEADQMFDLGFREALESLVAALPEKRRSHLVSATFPAAVRRLADRFQRQPHLLEGTKPGAAHADIAHVAHPVPGQQVYAGLVNLLLAAPGERTLVFVRRRTDTNELAEKLAQTGFRAAPFSGELPQAQRTRTLSQFRKGAIEILISTDVAARGIDVPDISTVIHVELPDDPAIYVHRSGRTGRAGRKGRSLLLVPARQRRRMERVLGAARIRPTWQPLPSAEELSRLQVERAQQELVRTLGAAPPPSETARAFAQRILAAEDPTREVAMLVEQAAPRPVTAPMELGPVLDADPPRRERKTGASWVRFGINYGTRSGATPQRVLAHVCRRGRLGKQDIGAIRIEPTRCSVEVARHVAEAFEANTRKRDSRDAALRITRLRELAAHGAPRERVLAERDRGTPERGHERRDRKGGAASAGAGDQPGRRIWKRALSSTRK